MNSSLGLPATTFSRDTLWRFIIFIPPICGAIAAFPLSYVSNTNVVIGFLLLPFVLMVGATRRFNYTFLLLAIGNAAPSIIYGVRITYFFTLAFFLLFITEITIGKVDVLIVFLLLFMSPFFEQVATIVGFPFRLLLSEWAGALLSLAGTHVGVEGNVMIIEGERFSVDEACMGLNLLSISLLMGTFLIAHHYRKTGRTLSFLSLIIFFGATFILNIAANLIRIMILVAFRTHPGDLMHEATGILCLVVYVVVPLYFLSRWMISLFGRTPTGEPGNPPLRSIYYAALFVVGAGIAFLGFAVEERKQTLTSAHANVLAAHFSTTLLGDGITRLSDEEVLVYVKPIPEFFSGEHTPLLCWRGSGYVFKDIREQEVAGHKIYTGTLVKGDQTLNTAWWYDNGDIVTVDQLTWRWRMFTGGPRYCVVNVTASDKATLLRRLDGILRIKLISNANDK